jgi:hypothetical protein
MWLMRALKQNHPGLVKANQRKIDVRRKEFDAHRDAIEHFCAISSALASSAVTSPSAAGEFDSAMPLGPTQK